MTSLRAFFLAIVLIIVLWSTCLFVSLKYVSDWQIRGQVGDMFGSVNALFSGLAFASLLYTIILQRNEQKIQRHELQLQREELRLQRIETKKSLATMNKQARYQSGQYNAAVAAIRVAAVQAYIEAEKLDAAANMADPNSVHSQRIREHADSIYELANTFLDFPRL